MCSKGIAKCILIVFNTIFFLLGVAVLALAIFVLLDESTITKVFGRIPSASETVDAALSATSILERSAYVLIAAGAFVFIIGFLGCCGAMCKSNLMLYLYAIFVFIILAMEIGAGVAGYFYGTLMDTELSSFLATTIKDYYEGSIGISNNAPYLASSESVTLAWDAAQAGLMCCGATAANNFELTSTNWNRTYQFSVSGTTQYYNAIVPASCCIMEDSTKYPDKITEITFTNLEGCLTSALASATHQTNCYDAIKSLFTKYMTYVIGIGIGVGLIEIIVIVGACVLIRAHNKDD